MDSTKNVIGNLKSIPEPKNKRKTGWPWTEVVSDEIYKEREYWPKISIVTPSYNQGQYIEETIRSVLMQNYPNLEYIIIDGGSTDDTLEIIKKYENQITYWVSEKDNGQSDAINKGIELCTGEIFNWINSDDFYEHLAFYNVVEAFLTQNKSVIIAKTRNFTSDKNWLTSTPIGDDFYMFSSARIDQPATFFNFSIFKRYSPLSVNLYLVMDAEIWFKFLLEFGKNYIGTINDIVVNFREHESSKTVNNRFNIVLDRARLYSLILRAYKGKNNQFTEFIYKCDLSRTSDIKKGIQGFILYWLKYSIKKCKISNSFKLIKYYFGIL